MHGRLAALIRAAALAALLGSSVLVGRGEAGPDRTKGGAKNVIFMMCDGMGPAHRDAIQLATVGPMTASPWTGFPWRGWSGSGTPKSHLCMKPRFNPDLTFV